MGAEGGWPHHNPFRIKCLNFMTLLTVVSINWCCWSPGQFCRFERGIICILTVTHKKGGKKFIAISFLGQRITLQCIGMLNLESSIVNLLIGFILGCKLVYMHNVNICIVQISSHAYIIGFTIWFYVILLLFIFFLRLNFCFQ